MNGKNNNGKNKLSIDDEVTVFASAPQQKVQEQNYQYSGFIERLKNQGNSKNNNGQIEIRTSVKGLIYKSVVYLNGQMIDAKEVDCKDLHTISDKETIFKERYTATHSQFIDKYMAKKQYKKVLEDEGKNDDDRHCLVTTYTSDDAIKSIVQIDGIEIDKLEINLDEAIKNDEGLLKTKYTNEHKKLVEKHFKIEKFPTNTIINPILKKLPFYKKNPMHSFYLFLLIVAFTLWIISLLMCGKALPRIINDLAGQKGKLVFMDLRKNFCGKCKDECCKEEPDLPECVLATCEQLVANNKFDQKCKDACNNGIISGEICKKIDDLSIIANSKSYTPIPAILKFESYSPTLLYIKNNLAKDIVVKLKEISIPDITDPTLSPEMIITAIGVTESSIYAKQDGKFEFKLEETIIKNGGLNNGSYKGKLVFEVLGAKDGEEKLEVPFEFIIK